VKRFIKSFRYGEKGFTLIELLVVIAILGILAAIVVPNFLGLIGSGSNESACIEERMVQTAVVAFAAEHNGDFPPGIKDGSLNDYFMGGDSEVLGTYGYDFATGVVDQTEYPGTEDGCVKATPTPP